MKTSTFFLAVLSIILPVNLLSITAQTSTMVHPESKKQVILLDDHHASYFVPHATQEELVLMEEIYQQQKSVHTQLAYSLLHLDPKDGGKTVVITEAGNNLLECMLEEEMGAAPIQEEGNTLTVMPRIFLQQLFCAGTTIDEKQQLFQANIQGSFNGTVAASLVMPNNVRWIIADRSRQEKDSMITFKIFQHYKGMKQSLESGEELPEAFTELTISHIKNYLTRLHELYEKHNITDTYYAKIMQVFDDVLATKKLTGDDHFSFLHAYLDESSQHELQEEFCNNILSCISLKTDMEFQLLINSFAQDANLDCLIVVAGGKHNEFIRTLLTTKGYEITATTGSEEINKKDGRQLFKDLKLSEYLNLVKNNPALTDVTQFGFTHAPSLTLIAAAKKSVYSPFMKKILVGGSAGLLCFLTGWYLATINK